MRDRPGPAPCRRAPKTAAGSRGSQPRARLPRHRTPKQNDMLFLHRRLPTRGDRPSSRVLRTRLRHAPAPLAANGLDMHAGHPATRDGIGLKQGSHASTSRLATLRNSRFPCAKGKARLGGAPLKTQNHTAPQLPGDSRRVQQAGNAKCPGCERVASCSSMLAFVSRGGAVPGLSPNVRTPSPRPKLGRLRSDGFSVQGAKRRHRYQIAAKLTQMSS